jgi:hypothetical protein
MRRAKACLGPSRGEPLILWKWKKILGRIVPERTRRPPYPDFAARQKKILGDRVINLNFAEFLREQRNRFRRSRRSVD